MPNNDRFIAGLLDILEMRREDGYDLSVLRFLGATLRMGQVERHLDASIAAREHESLVHQFSQPGVYVADAIDLSKSLLNYIKLYRESW